jgi:hypothetical protein
MNSSERVGSRYRYRNIIEMSQQLISLLICLTGSLVFRLSSPIRKNISLPN